MTETTRHRLRATPTGLDQNLIAPPSAVHAFIEAVLRENHFAIQFLDGRGPDILRVTLLEGMDPLVAKESAHFVPIEDLPRFSNHPALLIKTLATFQDFDLARVYGELRELVPAPVLLPPMPVNEHQVLLVGFGPELATLVNILSAIGEPLEQTKLPEGAIFPVSSSSLEIPPASDSNWNLLDLMHKFCVLTGQNLLLLSEVRRELERIPVGHKKTILVPPDGVYSFVESALIESGFMMHRVLSGEPCLLGITFTKDSIPNPLNRQSLFLPSTELEDHGRHPAVLIWTHVPLGGIRCTPRGAYNGSNNKWRNQMVGVYIPASNSVIAGGFGKPLSSWAGLVRLVREAMGD